MEKRHAKFSAGLRIVAFGAALAVAACSPSPSQFGLPQFSNPAFPTPQNTALQATPLAPAQGEIVGTGPVRVAMILPLSGSGNLTNAGRAMANGARLAVETMARSGNNTIHIVLKDSGSTEARAAALVREAVSEGAGLILGPVQASAVTQAGAQAMAANVPLIGFSNTAEAARPGVFLLAVLPDAEVMRAISYARSQGRGRAAAALVPNTAYGAVMGEAFARAAGETGLSMRGVLSFGNEDEARRQVEQIAPQIIAGQIDLLFLPDAATAPSFATLLQAAGVPRERVMIMGASTWAGQNAIATHTWLEGAVFPAIDPAGLASLSADYRARFGSNPPQLSTLAYSAILMAANPMLANSAPRYGPQMLVSPVGFEGRDGPFRFHYDGRGEYGLVINRIAAGGVTLADPARLGGLSRTTGGTSSAGVAIPAVGSSLLRN